MLGFLNINKPVGESSRAMVNRVHQIARKHKVGHAGTLDPLASGVLVVAVGVATRLIEFAQADEKRYRAEFLLGQRSRSDDMEFEIEHLENPPQPTRDEVYAALQEFVGWNLQRPPIFSAIKLQGRRAYEIAREGEVAEIPPRRVKIMELNLVSYQYPLVTVDIRCGKGVYVRSLGRDLGEALGSAAVMKSLVRTAVGEFELANAIHPDELTVENIEEHLIDAKAVVPHLPTVNLNEEQVAEVWHGKIIYNRWDAPQGLIAGIDSEGRLAAVMETRGELIKPHRNLKR